MPSSPLPTVAVRGGPPSQHTVTYRIDLTTKLSAREGSTTEILYFNIAIKSQCMLSTCQFQFESLTGLKFSPYHRRMDRLCIIISLNFRSVYRASQRSATPSTRMPTLMAAFT